MKIVFGAAFALVLLAAGASAQTPPAGGAAATPPAAAAAPVVPPSRCQPFPADPTLPNGATARSGREMQDGDRAYQAWGHATQAVLECRRAEAEELLTYARQHEARVNEYNAAVSHLNSVGTNWQAQATAYNSRHH